MRKKADPLKYHGRFRGKSFAFFGEFSYWPTFHIRGDPADLISALGGIRHDKVTKELDHLVIGDKRGRGRAKSKREAEKFNKKGSKIKVLDERGFFHLVRPDIKGRSFAFVGGFSKGPAGMEEGPAGTLAPFHVTILDRVEPDLDYLVMGDRRGKGKAAFLREAHALNDQGMGIRIVVGEGWGTGPRRAGA